MATAQERRRRIMERGSDRMALITGSISSLPSIDNNGGPDSHENATAAARLMKDDNSSEGFGRKSSEITEITKEEEIQTPALNKKTISQHPVMHPKTSTGSERVPNTRTRPTFFSSRRLNQCVIETENVRGCCAFVIAVLVLLTRSIVTLRPLYVMLLNDATIVLVRMFLDTQKGTDKAAEGKRAGPVEDGQNWGEAVKVLERGLAAYQAFRGVFIDSSIYMVVVICGLSLK